MASRRIIHKVIIIPPNPESNFGVWDPEASECTSIVREHEFVFLVIV